MLTNIEKVLNISNDILQKLSEVEKNTDAEKYLLMKKKSIDDAFQTIIQTAEINPYEYELFSLYKKSDMILKQLQNKKYFITRSDTTLYDTILKLYIETKDRIYWIQTVKLERPYSPTYLKYTTS
jgi:hypothetical protein